MNFLTKFDHIKFKYSNIMLIMFYDFFYKNKYEFELKFSYIFKIDIAFFLNFS